MNGARHVGTARAIARGGIELRHSLTYWPDLVQNLFFTVIRFVVLFLMRGAPRAGHHVLARRR